MALHWTNITLKTPPKLGWRLATLHPDDAAIRTVRCRDCGLLVYAIEHCHSHATREMRLDVAVQDEGSKVHALVANYNPGWHARRYVRGSASLSTHATGALQGQNIEDSEESLTNGT
jgi:uncharacterized OB-fold protein